MLRQLLHQLCTGVQLPECLRVMGCLRRMNTFTEHQLRVEFLRCRESWFAALVADIEEAEPHDHVKRLTDIYRLHLFDVIMQYRAVFFETSDDEQVRLVAGVFTFLIVHCYAQHLFLFIVDRSHHVSCILNLAASRQMMTQESGMVLTGWLQHRMSQYLIDMQLYLPSIRDASNFASVLEHCMVSFRVNWCATGVIMIA